MKTAEAHGQQVRGQPLIALHGLRAMVITHERQSPQDRVVTATAGRDMLTLPFPKDS